MKILQSIIILGILMLYSYDSKSQNNESMRPEFESGVIQPYVKNNDLYKEQVYIHFNKSCYLPGDDIWFSAYIFNPTDGRLNSFTKNLYVELYDETGKLQGQKLLPVTNGTANNLFKLKEIALPGKYIFRAYTNWMKNFGKAEEFDSPIEVVGNPKWAKEERKISFDVQFFPESGNLLEGVFNLIAVKAVDPNGKAVPGEGWITDGQNDTIVHFNLNQLGLGEFVMNPSPNTSYKAKIKLPGGKEQLVDLPSIALKGVTASVNNFLKNKITVELKSNTATIEKEQTFYILIHSNGNIFQVFTAKMAPDKTVVNFSLDRSKAGNGVNCLTVFDEKFHPVAERLFYNNKVNLLGKVELSHIPGIDSSEFKIRISRDSVKHLSNLSISVLPEGTVSNHFTNSLLAEVLLKSGIRGPVENPQYYIEKDDPEHSMAMELLLLTQGWRKYNWEDILNTQIPNSKRFPYKFENGFTITGVVKNWLNGKEDKNGSVSIVSPENKLFSVGKVDALGRYSFNGLYLMDSTQVLVSASNAKGKNWNRTLTAIYEPDNITDSLIQVKPHFSLPEAEEKKIEPPLQLMPGMIQLPEFVITADVKKPFEHSVYVSAFDKAVEVTKEKYLRYGSIENFLRTEFNIRVEIDEEGNYKIDMGRAQKNTQPKLIINDVEATDMSFLSTYTLDQIAAISVNKDGNAITGEGGAIIIETRKDAINWGTAAPTNLKTLFIKGYAQPVQYYTPKYLQSPDSETYRKYAALYWKPDIVVDSTGVSSSIKFSVPKEIKKVNLRTEGISDDGTIYLDERLVTIRKDN